jgi:hypothetical protein
MTITTAPTSQIRLFISRLLNVLRANVNWASGVPPAPTAPRARRPSGLAR